MNTPAGLLAQRVTRRAFLAVLGTTATALPTVAAARPKPPPPATGYGDIYGDVYGVRD